MQFLQSLETEVLPDVYLLIFLLYSDRLTLTVPINPNDQLHVLWTASVIPAMTYSNQWPQQLKRPTCKKPLLPLAIQIGTGQEP